MSQRTATSTPPNNSTSSTPNPSDPEAYRRMVEQVAEKVWVLWREELRQQRERRGKETR